MKQVITKRKDGTIDVKHYCEGESLAKDSLREQTDINYIMKQCYKTGQLPHSNHEAIFGDFLNGVTDYKTALDQVKAAESAFMELPAALREQYGNDPGTFINAYQEALAADIAAQQKAEAEAEKAKASQQQS